MDGRSVRFKHCVLADKVTRFGTASGYNLLGVKYEQVVPVERRKRRKPPEKPAP